MLEDVTAVAMKRVISWQVAQEMKAQHLTKTALAKRMHTSRASLNRLLDENDASLTLTTLASAAAALGEKSEFAAHFVMTQGYQVLATKPLEKLGKRKHRPS